MNNQLNESLEALFREIKRVQAAKRAAPRQRKALSWTVGWWTVGAGIKKNLLPAVFVGFCGLIAVVLGLFLAPPVRTTEMHLQEPTAPILSLDRPIYLRVGAVICPQVDVLGAFLDGRQAGGEAEGHRAVQQLFLRAGGECIRTIARDPVRVVDKDVSGDRLVKIQWAGMTNLAFTRDLSN